MTLRIGSQAPDFEVNTTHGPIRFHEWIGSSWCVLFSHLKDFTPVCTTELGYMAQLKPLFEQRNCKIIGLSVNPVDDHQPLGARHRGGNRVRVELSADRRLRPKGGQTL